MTTSFTAPPASLRSAAPSGSGLSGHGDVSLLDRTLAALEEVPVSTVEIPARPGVTSDWPGWADDDVVLRLRAMGIDRPWLHQVVAADLAHSGNHVVLSTGTASGKSLGYWLPSLTALAAENATVLYLTPTKALAQDQLARLRELAIPQVQPATYDGDTAGEVRPTIRNRANYILTNPDMLHRSILPRHQQWARFLRRLQYVVLDESHTYRGVFGCHMAAVVRRLRRVAATYGADPTFIISSATLAHSAHMAHELIGAECTPVSDDTSQRGATTLVLCQPDSSAHPAQTAFTVTANVLAAWCDNNSRSLGFIRSRAGAELLARTVSEQLWVADPAQVTAYRGGLLPEERREIEQRLRSGELLTVAATNALELGIDISGLDAVAICGWPGTKAAFRQQIGRAGRSGDSAVAVLVAQQDPLDRYYAQQPEQLVVGPVESCVFDPHNPHVLLPHLACAIAEVPMTSQQAITTFGEVVGQLLPVLAERGFIRLRGDTWHWVARGKAADLTDLRGSSAPVTIIEEHTGRILGTVDGGAAPATVHKGAVYIHLGWTHMVVALDLERRVATVVAEDPGFTTSSQSVSDLRIVSDFQQRRIGVGTLHFGEVEVSNQVVSYLQRQEGTGVVTTDIPLNMAATSLATKSVWWKVGADQLATLALTADRYPGAAHAAEHASIGMLPALATCDRSDIGGLSTVQHPDTDELTVFVYDGHPGGAGFAECAFEQAERWLQSTFDIIAACDCSDGCPGCVQSPKCGNGNEPLDKAGALVLLRALLT